MGNDVDVAAGVTPTLDLRAPRCASPSAQLHERGLLISAVVIVTRLVWQNTIVFLIRAIDRRPHLVAERTTWRLRTVGAWAGIRGAVSLAAALALPAGFPQRDLLVFLTSASSRSRSSDRA